MPMRPCEKCLENNWSFAVDEGVVTATCRSCENEVSFLTKQAKRKALNLPSKRREIHGPNINAQQRNDYLHQDPGEDDRPPWD